MTTSVIFNTAGMTDEQSKAVNEMARYMKTHGACVSFEAWKEEDAEPHDVVWMRAQFDATYDDEVCMWILNTEGIARLM